MDDMPLDKIIESRNICAQIIAECGQQFLPIFERLEQEITAREKSEVLLQKALKVAHESGTHFSTQNGTHLKIEFNEDSK